MLKHTFKLNEHTIKLGWELSNFHTNKRTGSGPMLLQNILVKIMQSLKHEQG